MRNPRMFVQPLLIWLSACAIVNGAASCRILLASTGVTGEPHEHTITEEESHWRTFETWFTINGGTKSSKIGFRQFQHYGRGYVFKQHGAFFKSTDLHGVLMDARDNDSVIAEQDIQVGEELVVVPRRLLMTSPPHTSAIDPALEYTMQAYPQSPTHEAALSLMYYKLNASSFWHPYADILPASFSTTIYFTQEELVELSGTSLLEYTRKRLDNIHRQYDEIARTLFEAFPDIYDMEEYTLERFKWALSALWSRSFRITVDNTPQGAMVPMACMFNTHANPDYIKVGVKPAADEGLIYFATAPILVGEQIFVSYGMTQMNNARYLMDYGFVLEDNPYDMTLVNFPLMGPDVVPNWDRKIRVIESGGFRLSGGFPIYKGELEQSVFHTLRILRVIYATLPELSVAEKVFAEGKGATVSTRNEQYVLRLLEGQVKKALAAFPTSLDEDEDYIQRYADRLSENARNAVEVRIGEKRILVSLQRLLAVKRDEVMAHKSDRQAAEKKKTNNDDDRNKKRLRKEMSM